jgi:hypothetical protein
VAFTTRVLVYVTKHLDIPEPFKYPKRMLEKRDRSAAHSKIISGIFEPGGIESEKRL